MADDVTISIKPTGSTRSSKSKSRSSRKEKKSGKRRGCLYIGCLGVSLLGLLLTAALGFIIWLYISSGPEPLPQIKLTPAQVDTVKKRLELFEKALDEGRRAEVSFTGDELNVIVQTFPQFERYKKFIHLYIEQNTVKGQVSFPPSMFAALEPYVPEGIFLNGIGTFKVYMSQGTFHVHMQELELKKSAAPSAIMTAIRDENLAARIPMDVRRKDRLKKIRSITVKRNRLYAESWGISGKKKLKKIGKET